MTDDLRARLARVDPVRRLDDLAESPTAHEIRERVMRTIEQAETTTPAATPLWRRPAFAGAVAAGVAAAAVGVAVLAGGNDAAPPQVAQRAPTVLALKAPASSGVSMNSCMPFSVDVLRGMPVALAGTAVAVTPDNVTIDVDRWYKGGDADQVTIATPGATTSVALDGVEFTQGTRYLLTATEGTVNVCGYSAPATAELEKSFAEAFPA